MKKTTTAIMMALALGISGALAQPSGGMPDDGAPPPDGPPGDGQGQGDFQPPRPPRSPLLMALDVNHDGIIDSNEIANASAELLTLDKNHDGQLTPDEYRPKRPHGRGFGGGPGPGGGPDQGGQGQRPPPDDNNSSQPSGPPGSDQGDFHPQRPPRFPLEAALDVNGDGIIDSNEIANASAELLTLDKNHDGQLTPDEYRPKRPHGRGFGGPGGGQGGPGQGGPDQGGPGEGQPPPPDDGGQRPPPQNQQ